MQIFFIYKLLLLNSTEAPACLVVFAFYKAKILLSLSIPVINTRCYICYSICYNRHNPPACQRTTFGFVKILPHTMSKRKPARYKGEIESLPEKIIYINVNNLEKGDYELDIIHKNKVLTKAAFKKE